MTHDSIQITGIRAYGYTGVLPEEQQLGQWFEVDLTLWCDLSTAAKSDRLEDTYDYRSAVKAVQQLIQTSRFALIERLAGAIADTILQAGGISHIKVRLSKLAAPIPEFGGTISVDIERKTDAASS
jgi:dihydroneopterin aldolase